MGVPPCRLDRTEVLEPGGAVSLRRSHAFGERAQHRRAVADDRRVRDAVPAELARVAVNMDQLPLPETAIAKAEVERRPDDADDVRLLECRAPGVLEEELVAGRQRAATRAVQVDGYAARLGETRKLGGGAVPPDAASRHDGRTLGSPQEVGRLVQPARVGEGARRLGRERDGLRIAVGEEDVGGKLEVHRPAWRRERLPECERHVLGDPVDLRAHRGPLRDRLHQRELVELLQRTPLRLRERPGAAEHDHRRLGGKAVCDGRDGPGHPRPRGDEGDARRAPDSPPRLGGVRRGLLVADVHDADALVPAPLVDRHHVAAGEREDRVDARGRDRARREPAALDPFSHRAGL